MTSRPARLLPFALLAIAWLFAAPPPPARPDDGKDEPPDEKTVAKFTDMAAKVLPALEANLVHHAETAAKNKLHDDVRTICDRILRLFPENARARELLAAAKGKSSNSEYPDRQALKHRNEFEDQVRANVKAAYDLYVKDCLTIFRFCQEARYREGMRQATRMAWRLQPDNENCALPLGYVKVADGGWIHSSQKPLLDLLAAAVLADDEAKRKQATDDLLGRKDLDLVELQETIRHCALFPDLKGRGAEEKVKITVDGEEADYYLRVPVPYSTEKKWPVYITLHPKDGFANFWVRIFKRYQKMYEQYIVAAPTLITPKSKITWRDEKAVRQVDVVLKDLLQKYNVDTNRVFLDGFGIGCACLTDAQYTPDRFAGVVCRDRVYFIGKEPSKVGLEGLLNLPVYLMLGSNVEDYREKDADAVTKLLNDLECPHIYRTIVGKGEDPFTNENAHIFEWLGKQARDPFPRRIAFAPETNTPVPMDRVYWLQLTDFTWKATVEAEYAGNTIEVKTDRVKAFDLLLSDRFIDLGKPVRVVVNGKEKWNAVVPRDLSFLLAHVRATRDRERTFVARLPIEVYKPRDKRGEGETDSGEK